MTTYTAHEILGGLYEKTVKMTVDRRLRYVPYAQAGWIDTIKRYTDNENNGKPASYCKAMYSYSSLIFTATVNEKGVVDMIDTQDTKAAANCSRTTSRQVTLAMRELGFSNAVITALKKYISVVPHSVYLLLSGRDWIDSDAGEVIYAGGAAV